MSRVVKLLCCFALFTSCAKSTIECDNPQIKKIFKEKARSSVEGILNAEQVKVIKIHSIKTKSKKNSGGKQCEADIVIKAKGSKYNAHYAIELGDSE